MLDRPLRLDEQIIEYEIIVSDSFRVNTIYVKDIFELKSVVAMLKAGGLSIVIVRKVYKLKEYNKDFEEMIKKSS